MSFETALAAATTGTVITPPSERLIEDHADVHLGLLASWSLAPGMDFLKAIVLLNAHVAGTGNLTIELW